MRRPHSSTMKILNIGHRGARGLLPENTIPAFSRAIELGVDYIELDVGLTKEKTAVVHHNYRLNPDTTRDENGQYLTGDLPAIRDLTVSELQRYDIGRINPSSKYFREIRTQQPVDGCRIPTLAKVAQLLDESDSSTKLLIEVKSARNNPGMTYDSIELAVGVAAEIKSLKLGSRAVIQSFDWQVLRNVKECIREIEVWHLTCERSDYNTVEDSKKGLWTAGTVLSDCQNSVPKMVKANGGTHWGCNVSALSLNRIEEARELELKVCAWTANEPEEFEFLAKAGVFGIVTDYPDRLAEYLAQS